MIRGIDVPASDEALLDTLTQGRNVGSQVVHILRAKRSLELDDLSVHLFERLLRAIHSAPELGCRSVPRAYKSERSYRQFAERRAQLGGVVVTSSVIVSGRFSKGRFCCFRDHLRSSRVISPT
jgi:hypothetical protein